MLGKAYKSCPACQARAGAEHRFCPSCGADLLTASLRYDDPYVDLTIAGKYVLRDHIGEGAMGRVYRAEQLPLRKSFAVKILAPHLMHDEASHARFASEAQNAASLNHPNCVSVVDYGRTAEGVTYIVMEFIQGISLERLIVEEEPLPRERVIDLTLQILAALTEAHGLGILHRDLKPDNMLVQQLRTHGELVKVLDFGIAKLMDSGTTGPDPGLTHQGIVCGTPEYMSPEQARGQRLDARSDLYAVGVILYQMMTGRLPFESESTVEVLHMHIHDPPVPPSRLGGSTDADPLEAVCMRALSKNPEDRFASAEAFRQALIVASSAGGPEPARVDRPACTACGGAMDAQARFCSACGAPAPVRPANRSRRHPTRRSGLWTPIPSGRESTAEVLIRRFPLTLAGRDRQVQRAQTVLAERRAGVRVVVLHGPPGIGKTRLGDEVAVHAEGLGYRVFYVGADPSGARSPLFPIRQMVGQILDLDPEQVTTQDLGRAANLSGVAFEELPGLAELFGLQGPAYDMEYQVRRRECYASSSQALVCGSRSEPLLLVFDDVDRYDRPSRDVLRRLSHTETERPVVVIACSAEADAGWLGGQIETLTPLATGEVENLCRNLSVGVNPDSRLPPRLARSAPLPPLRLELQLRLLALGVEFLPEASDADLIRVRIEALSAATRAVLGHAAILGERFAEDDLRAALALDRSAPTGGELDDILVQLHVGGLLLITRPGERAFSHKSVHDVAYNMVPTLERQARHHRAATCTRAARRSIPVRAVHLLGGGDPDAIPSLELAADNAVRLFDDLSARDYLMAAMRTCGQLPEGPDRELVEARLLRKASETVRGGDVPHSTLEFFTRRLAEVREPENAGALRRALGRHYLRQGEIDLARRAFEDALGKAIASGDRGAILEVYTDLGKLYARQGDLRRALKEMHEGLDLCTLGEGPRADLDIGLWRFLLRMSELERGAGDLRQARVLCEHALYQAERQADSLGRLRCHAQMAWLLRELHQLTLAEQHVARALDEARYFGDRLTTAELLLERARARAARGKLHEARHCCEEALRLARVLEWTGGVLHAERAIALLDQRGEQQVAQAK